MTTTSDEDALLAAIADNPDDVGAKLAHADLVGESDPLQGCMLRILAQPDCDDWLLQYAQAIEPVDSARAEFIRVQCGLATTPRFDPYRCEGCGETADADGKVVHGAKCGYPGSSEYIGSRRQWIDLRNRDLRLLDDHEADWRRAGPCKRCGGAKRVPIYANGDHKIEQCWDCNGTGDRGGLLERHSPHHEDYGHKGPSEWRHPVQWRRGFIEQIDARLDEVLQGEYNLNRDGHPLEWRPTAPALAWVREFPTCQRVRLVDRVPARDSGDQRGLYWGKESFDWWDASTMNGNRRDHPDYLPSIVHAKIRELYPESVVQPDPRAETYGLVEFGTAEAAHKAASVATVAVLRAHNRGHLTRSARKREPGAIVAPTTGPGVRGWTCSMS